MRSLNALTLAVALTTAVACDSADSPPAPGVPISAPNISDLRRTPHATGCMYGPIKSGWRYTWMGDQLQTAVLATADGYLSDNQVFTYDDAGRLVTWTWGAEGLPTEVQLTRDADGAVTRWTHAFAGDGGLVVTVSRGNDGDALHMVGRMFLGFETPLLIDLDRIDPDLPRLSPRFALIFGHLERLAQAREDESVWNVLDALDATQRVEQGAQGETTIIDVDGDGAPDVIERVTRAGDATTTTVDYAADALIDVTVEAVSGRSERTEVDADGVRTRTVTLAGPEHLFIDRLDASGAIADRTSLFFDANGARLLKYEDENADGVPNWRKRYRAHPDTGLRIFDETDAGADGSIERLREYTHNRDGNLTSAMLTLVEPGDCGDIW